MIIPLGIPVIINLNSYYLDMGKLIEHYQGELNAGSIYLKSHPAEGLIFFDEDTITHVFYQEKNNWLDGKPARNRLIEALNEYNFNVRVDRIEPDKFHYWANVNYAEDFDKDHGAGITALDELIKRVSAENLTGYIDVSFTDEAGRGLVFFTNGNIFAASCPWLKGGSRDTKKNLRHLILKTKTSVGIFSVKRIDLNRAPGEEARSISGRVFAMIQDLLATLESLVIGEKRIKNDFNTLLKKKFFEKADTYEFLDPFAAEFRYAGGRFEFSGNAAPEQLVRGVSECARDLAADLGLLTLFRKHLETWKQTYRNEISKYKIEL